MECRLPDVGFGDDSNAVLRREYLAVIVLVAPWSVARFLVLEVERGSPGVPCKVRPLQIKIEFLFNTVELFYRRGEDELVSV